MKLTVIHATPNCEDVACPTVYVNEAGNYVFQGYKVEASQKSEINIPQTEDIVELPKEFIEAFIKEQTATTT